MEKLIDFMAIVVISIDVLCTFMLKGLRGERSFLLPFVSDIMGPTEYGYIHTYISQILEASILLRTYNAWGKCIID